MDNDVNSNIISFNDSYSELQEEVLETIKNHNNLLASIYYQDNKLYYNNESFDLGYYRLTSLPTVMYDLDAKTFFKLTKFIVEAENNYELEENKLFNKTELLNKNNLTEEEKVIITDFTNDYLFLEDNQKILVGKINIILSKYRFIINNILWILDPNNLTEGQQLVLNMVRNKKDEELNGRSNSMTRVLKNPNVPNMAPDEENFSKAGFASILFIIYSLINAAIILAIHMIK